MFLFHEHKITDIACVVYLSHTWHILVAVNDFSGGVRDHYTTLTNLKQLFFNHEL